MYVEEREGERHRESEIGVGSYFHLFFFLFLFQFIYLFLFTDAFQWTGRLLSLFNLTNAKSFIPIISSVAEHQPALWDSLFFDIPPSPSTSFHHSFVLF